MYQWKKISGGISRSQWNVSFKYPSMLYDYPSFYKNNNPFNVFGYETRKQTTLCLLRSFHVFHPKNNSWHPVPEENEYTTTFINLKLLLFIIVVRKFQCLFCYTQILCVYFYLYNFKFRLGLSLWFCSLRFIYIWLCLHTHTHTHTHTDQNRDPWRTLLNTVVNFEVP
jgi:hypothetical protein